MYGNTWCILVERHIYLLKIYVKFVHFYSSSLRTNEDYSVKNVIYNVKTGCSTVTGVERYYTDKKQCKMSSSLKSDLEWDFAAGVYQSEAPSPPRYCHGVVEQFCRFWIWSDGECKILAEYGLQQDSTPPTPPRHTLFVYTCTVLWHRDREKR
jgi:hypothetical protein